jgi:signal transduction histidine kinase
MPRPFTSSDAHRLWTMLVLLLLAVLAPTLFVLWFMNQAVANERWAVRQRLQEVYQGELTARQKRLDEQWKKVDASLAATQTTAPAEAFRQLVTREGFTSVLVYRPSGTTRQLQYPVLVPRPVSPDAEDFNDLARASVGAAQNWLAQGNPSMAVDTLAAMQSDPHQRDAIDAQGRAIAPNGLLMAITLLPPDNPRRSELTSRLADRLNEDGLMIAPQRLFLMEQLHALTKAQFPTQAAEQWAFYLSQLEPLWDDKANGTLRPVIGAPQSWIYQNLDYRVLFTAEDIQQRFAAAAQADAPAGTTIALLPPGEKPDAFLIIPASPLMPDWRLTLSLTGPDPFAATARQNALVYQWMALLAIGITVLLATILTLYLARQMRLTRLKNDLIATVSHELKTPLSSMRVLVETLLDNRVPGPREQREYLDLIARENMRLSRLIDNFLTFSRMERHKAVFDFRPVDVAALVRDALTAMGDRASAIQSDIPEDLTLWGDADALVTVLVNLLDNAWKYSPDPKHIELSARALDDTRGGMEIAVRDHGIGIARRHHRRIFHRFYQIDRNLSRRSGGCGLGLAIVDYIVQAHHGTISVDSQLAQGATFRLRLPRGIGVLADATCPTEPPPSSTSPAPHPLPGAHP